MTTTYAGIDYSLGRSNVNHETGIHYGVVHANEVGERWFEDAQAEYGDPTCPKCGNTAIAADTLGKHEPGDEDCTSEPHECEDYACMACKHLFGSESAFGDDPLGFSYTDSEYTCTQGQDGDIFVIASPYYSRSQFCSPCAPGAGYLMTPCETGPKTYCLGHEWFENGKAPYPVYRVADDTEVRPDDDTPDDSEQE